MTRMQERFWDWATSSALRFGGCLLVAHTIVTKVTRRERHG